MATLPVSFSGKSRGQRSLRGLQPMGSPGAGQAEHVARAEALQCKAGLRGPGASLCKHLLER